MNLKTFVSALAVSAALACMPVQASDPATSGEMTMEQLASRLKLTPEQQSKIAPYAEARRAKLQDIHSRMSPSASRKDKRAALQEAKQAQDEFVKNVEPVLTAGQQTEWKKLRDEARAQMKERMHNR